MCRLLEGSFHRFHRFAQIPQGTFFRICENLRNLWVFKGGKNKNSHRLKEEWFCVNCQRHVLLKLGAFRSSQFRSGGRYGHPA